MMRNKRLLSRRIVSILLVVSMLVTLLSGCGRFNYSGDEAQSGSNNYNPVNAEPIVESFIEGNLDNLPTNESTLPITPLSTTVEDYQGDIETFVYGLMVNQLEYIYDVFPAKVELLDGTSVYGIAYTDYKDCYTNEEETVFCFEAGFIPFVGEVEIPDEDFNSGLTITNLDDSVDNTIFILGYGSGAFTEHCVVYGQYVKYGVDESGRFFFTAEKYTRDYCDSSLGSLYSYDESKYVYDIDVGNYINVTGSSIYSQIDYDELQTEINRILETQDANLVSVDIESCAYIAQDAVINCLLSMQEETFLGYSVAELVEAVEELDPMQCFRVIDGGPVVIDLDYDGGADALTKWLVGTGCVIVTAVAMVGSVVFVECPPLSALSSAMAGTAIEIFMEVVVSGETLDNINWGKVVIAAATGAVSGYLGPYVYASTAGAGYFLADSSLDGLLGGIERAASAWLEGEDGVEIIKSFGYGVALGFALSAGFKAAGGVAEKLTTKIGPSISKLTERVFPKLTGKISTLSSTISKGIYTLKKTADSSVFHSEYISRKLALRQIERILEDGADDLAKKAIDHLSPEDIVDSNGSVISKDMLRDMFNDADDGAILAYYKKGTELVQIVKKNGMVGIVFDSSKYQTVTLPNGISGNRLENFEEAAKILKKQWLDDPTLIPESLAISIKKSGIDLEDMDAKKIVSIIQQSDWVMHENIDLATITLVPRSIHNVVEGGIAHMGGVGLAKYLKSHMSMEFFERFISAAATGAIQATN
ncbi:hypothetical protein [Fusibacillus kribbianus]|uniref:Uncharacterized protein n=1 Tax=Fusibacillus kribbianus TaxID=3044208 RepID=A0AAP4BC08_9FIRM|nr:hypothetical protein [Ruminococcus sp. YH-rum2234]MDI9243200.1 hypothetical protein [Ruminococcus sp. YH-rum2234]